MARKRSKWATEAAQQALLRFGPEESGLRELQRTAEDTYKSTVKTAEGSAASIVNAVDAARPAVSGVYDRAGLAQAATASLLGGDLAALPGVANSIKAGAALEQAQGIGNLREAQGAALGDLTRRRVAAVEGAGFAKTAASSKLVDDLAKLLTRKQDLAREKGTFTALTTSQLTDAARERAQQVSMNNADNSQSERNSVRTSGIDPDTGKPIPGGKLDPKAQRGKVSATGKKLLSGEKHLEIKTEVAKAVSALQTLDPTKKSRHEAAPLLVNGADGQQLYNPDKPSERQVDASGQPIETPKIPAVGWLASVAADVYYDGHLSRSNQRALADAGLSLRQLGLPTYGQWKRRNPKVTTERGRAQKGLARSIPALPVTRVG